MQKCDDGDRASLYALGLLDEAESGIFERHLSSCPACTAEVRQSGDLAVELARTMPASAPPAGLRQRVLSEARPPRGVVALVRGAEMNWEPTPFEGVFMARLYQGFHWWRACIAGSYDAGRAFSLPSSRQPGALLCRKRRFGFRGPHHDSG